MVRAWTDPRDRKVWLIDAYGPETRPWVWKVAPALGEATAPVLRFIRGADAPHAREAYVIENPAERKPSSFTDAELVVLLDKAREPLLYKGYRGEYVFDAGTQRAHGRVLIERGQITFEGTSLAELQQAMRHAVDAYLRRCAENGITPIPPASAPAPRPGAPRSS